jgi:hypothetical protein
MSWRLIKFCIWYTFACGVFALIVPHLLVNDALASMGERVGRISTDSGYLLSVSTLRVAGLLFFAFAMTLNLLIKQGWTLENLKLTMTIVAINLLIWAGAFVFLLSSKSAIALSIIGLVLLLWLIIPVLLLFDYKKTDSWESVKPK